MPKRVLYSLYCTFTSYEWQPGSRVQKSPPDGWSAAALALSWLEGKSDDNAPQRTPPPAPKVQYITLKTTTLLQGNIWLETKVQVQWSRTNSGIPLCGIYVN